MDPKDNTPTIRRGNRNDLPHVFKLVIELADFENSMHQISNTVEMMEMDCLGERPVLNLFIVEHNAIVIGMALTFFGYSSWRGKAFSTDDFIIKKQYRRQGLGSLLFDRLIEFAKEENCKTLSLQALSWNDTGLNFYKKYNMQFDNEWINCRLKI